MLSSGGSSQNETWSSVLLFAHKNWRVIWSCESRVLKQNREGVFAVCCLAAGPAVISCSPSFLLWLGDRSGSWTAIAGSSPLPLGLKTIQVHLTPTLSPLDPTLVSPPLFLSIFCPANRTTAAEKGTAP
jgi:hypothetical protein